MHSQSTDPEDFEHPTRTDSKYGTTGPSMFAGDQGPRKSTKKLTSKGERTTAGLDHRIWDAAGKESVFTGDSRGILKLWSVKNRNLVKEWNDHKKPLLKVSCGHDSKYIFSLDEDGHLMQHDITAHTMKKDFYSEHAKGVRVFCLTDDNKWIFTTGNDDKDLKMFNVETGNCEHTFKDAHNDLIVSMQSSSCVGSLFTGSMDGWFKEWNFKEKKMIKDYGRVHLGYIGFIEVGHFGNHHQDDQEN